MITGNESAMPYVIQGASYEDRQVEYGLTIRQHFAIMAMQGLLASVDHIEDADKFYAQVAVEHADALIAELNKLL